MTITPEGRVKRALINELEKAKAYYFMPVQTGMGKRTLDFLVCFKGYFFGIEAKAPGGKLTALQEKTIRDIGKAGGECIVIDSEEAAHHLGHWLEIHSERG